MSTGDIHVEQVWKTFRIFHDRNTTLKQALLRRRKAEQFEQFWALRDVSFTVPSGSTFGLVGANGAGKSTMLKVLSRILIPDKGSVTVNGRISALLELGAGFHPELTGRENVFLNGSILGMSTAGLRSKFDSIVEFAGLEQFIDQPVKTYSSGMYARLGFSVAVAVEPDILLVDEVLAVGDEQFQRRCAEKMTELRSGGRTVIVVSHSLAQVQQICDQAVWLDKGTVRATGPTEVVVDRYLASVTTAYRLDAQGRQRTGSGEVQLEVELINPAGSPQFATGSPMSIRFHWATASPIADAAFSFSVRGADGHEVAGASDIIGRDDLTIPSGTGFVDFDIRRLSLLPGLYHIAAAVMDRHSGHIYDHSPNIAQFDVAPAAGHEFETGVLTLGGEWSPRRAAKGGA